MKLIFMSPLGKVLTSSNFECHCVLIEFILSSLFLHHQTPPQKKNSNVYIWVILIVSLHVQ